MVLKRPALSLFKLATLNVRGLTSNIKRQHLAADMDSYGEDFGSLQELKINQAFDQVTSNGGKSFHLISFGEDSGKHGGLGFVMSPRVEPFLVQHKRLSDRVGLADFKFPRNPNAKNKNNILDVRFVAAYGPTSPPAEANQEIRERFCDKLPTVRGTGKRRALFLYAGDFNSKVALASSCHQESNLSWFNTSGCPTESALPTSSFHVILTLKTKTIYSTCALSQLTVLPVHQPRLIKRFVKGSVTSYQLCGVRGRGERCFCMRVISTAK